MDQQSEPPREIQPLNLLKNGHKINDNETKVNCWFCNKRTSNNNSAVTVYMYKVPKQGQGEPIQTKQVVYNAIPIFIPRCGTCQKIHSNEKIIFRWSLVLGILSVFFAFLASMQAPGGIGEILKLILTGRTDFGALVVIILSSVFFGSMVGIGYNKLIIFFIRIIFGTMFKPYGEFNVVEKLKLDGYNLISMPLKGKMHIQTSRFWKCPNCGEILDKGEDYVTKTNMYLSPLTNTAGIVSCGKCGYSFDWKSVYGGRYDVTGPY